MMTSLFGERESSLALVNPLPHSAHTGSSLFSAVHLCTVQHTSLHSAEKYSILHNATCIVHYTMPHTGSSLFSAMHLFTVQHTSLRSAKTKVQYTVYSATFIIHYTMSHTGSSLFSALHLCTAVSTLICTTQYIMIVSKVYCTAHCAQYSTLHSVEKHRAMHYTF